MKNLTFRVELSFADDISQDDELLRQVANNIAESLRHTAQTAGLLPEDSDTYTDIIRVTPQYLNETTIVHTAF
jgi:hypothetical protein